MTQTAVPTLDVQDVANFVGSDWFASTDPFPSTNLFPYIDGSTQPLGTIWINNFSGFNQKTTVGFRFQFGDEPGNSANWDLTLTYRYTGASDPGNVLHIKLCNSDDHTVFAEINRSSVGAPGVFQTGSFTFDEGEISAIRSGINYIIVFEVEELSPGSTSWDISFAELEVPDAGSGIEVTGDGGIEISGDAVLVDNEYTGEGGIETGGNLASNDLVISADASGIYTLIQNQHFDTILARNTTDNQTVDVRIPDPYGKTAYVGE